MRAVTRVAKHTSHSSMNAGGGVVRLQQRRHTSGASRCRISACQEYFNFEVRNFNFLFPNGHTEVDSHWIFRLFLIVNIRKSRDYAYFGNTHILQLLDYAYFLNMHIRYQHDYAYFRNMHIQECFDYAYHRNMHISSHINY